MFGSRLNLGALRQKFETNSSFRDELNANPRSVLARETGLAVSELEQLLTDAELQNINAGGSSADDSERMYCRDCEFSGVWEILIIHRILIHGSFSV